MGRSWHLVDTGLRSAAQNIALDRALLEARKAEEIPTTLRFFRTTASALLGLQDSAAQEVNSEFCRAHAIAVQRRVSGGTTYYTDAAQLGWALYTHKQELHDKDLRQASRQLCHALATALSAFGIDARVRRHDEIEVDGRVVGGCGSAADGGVVLFHGWIFLALDMDVFVQTLRMPAADAPETLRAAASERFTDLVRLLRFQPATREVRQNIAEALESAYDAELIDADVTMSEESRYRRALPEIDTPGWTDLVTRPPSAAPQLEAVERSPRGVIRAALVLDAPSQTLKRIWLQTERPVNPRRTLLDLEAELRDVPLANVRRRIDWFFGSRPVTSDFTADDIAMVIARAVGQPLLAPNS